MNPTPEEEQQAQNEIEALKLELNFGAHTFIADDAPPDMVSEWLKNVKAFEENYKKAIYSPIYKLIGEPELPKEILTDQQKIKHYITTIEKLCLDNGIKLLRPSHLDENDYYLFLKNDILSYEITAPVGEMIQVLDYDDFYQDSPDFIPITTQAMVESIIDLSQAFDENLLAEECRKQIGAITKQEALSSIQIFRNKYSQINGIGFSNLEIQQTTSALYQIFGIHWQGIDKNSGIQDDHNGIGICQLNLYDRAWKVEGITFPGFDF